MAPRMQCAPFRPGVVPEVGSGLGAERYRRGSGPREGALPRMSGLAVDDVGRGLVPRRRQNARACGARAAAHKEPPYIQSGITGAWTPKGDPHPFRPDPLLWAHGCGRGRRGCWRQFALASRSRRPTGQPGIVRCARRGLMRRCCASAGLKRRLGELWSSEKSSTGCAHHAFPTQTVSQRLWPKPLHGMVAAPASRSRARSDRPPEAVRARAARCAGYAACARRDFWPHPIRGWRAASRHSARRPRRRSIHRGPWARANLRAPPRQAPRPCLGRP